jgi:threonylcarbamoyladenosine tRNA methylthiotransferase MtaB
MPETAITTDIIVGFPAETDGEFEESYEFCRRMEFARIHVFPFSPRPGTTAAGMRPRVPDKVKRERTKKMLALAEESARNFRQRFTGKTLPVLWEQQTGGLWSGLTSNYLRVHTRSTDDLTNQIRAVAISSEG